MKAGVGRREFLKLSGSAVVTGVAATALKGYGRDALAGTWRPQAWMNQLGYLPAASKVQA